MKDYRRAMLIVNPASGKGAIKEVLFEVITHLFQHGIIVSLFITQKPNDATRFVAEGGSYDMILCSGGDGTLNEVVNGIMQNRIDKPLGYIPNGTVNDFATSLGISLLPTQAVKTITRGATHELDVGIFGERYFTYVAAAGAFSDVSYSTPQKLKNTFGRYAYYYEGLRKIPDIATAYPLSISVNDEPPFTGFYSFIAVANTFSIGGILQFKATAIDLSDGCLELLLIRSPQNPAELQKLIQSLRTRNYDNDLLHCHQGSKFHITSPKPLNWSIDGESGGINQDITITVADQRLKFIY